mmetsp:Transcript_142496/g.454713  ORF Transcript_142496/g.454713 Transcript_142496/m.454713 type:complete len:122 (+) Transcript_142496:3-368(+)
MREFRKVLRLSLACRFVYRRAVPRQSDLGRNFALLELCFRGSSRTDALRQAIILKLLGGDWEGENVVHNCVGLECCMSKEHCLEKMVSVLVPSLQVLHRPPFHDTGGQAQPRQSVGLSCCS